MPDLSALSRFFPKSIHTVAITAPASPAHDSKLADLVIQSLRTTGIKVVVTPNARLGEPGDTYSAIDARLRARDLEQAWLNPDVQLILPIRGGGGGLQLIQELDWNKLMSRPSMPVLGFSDLTLLHAAMLARHCGRPITSPTLLDIPLVTADSVLACRHALAGTANAPYALTPLRAGTARGPIFAAHLQRLVSLLDTPFFPELDGRVLFLECPHRNETQLTALFRQLLNSGKLRHLAGLVFGQFPDCTSIQAADAMLKAVATSLTCPVFADFPFGHTPQLHALDSAANAQLSADGMLTIVPAAFPQGKER